MSILLLGKDGQVGRELQRSLLPLGHLVALGRSEVDLERTDSLPSLLAQHKPRIIVNAAAYTAVDQAETLQAKAYKVNHEAVEIIAQYAQQTGALFVHYSTDYVFDGLKTTPYLETDTPCPQSVYGFSKLAGENAIIQTACRTLIFRTSWVFSSHGNNFIKTILRLARERDTLNVVNDQYGAPTSAELIADVTALAISHYGKQQLPAGIYHLTAAGTTTWFDLARYALQRASDNGMTFTLNPIDAVLPIPASSYPLPAKRPQNSRLATKRLATCLGIELPDWNIYVDRMIQQLSSAY